MATLEEQILQSATETGTSDDSGVKPWTVDLGSNKLTFNTPEELSENLKQALAQVNGEVTRIRQENEQLKSLQNQTQGQYAETDSAVTNTKFNMDHFINQMKADPIKAFDYVDEIRFGSQKPSQDIKEALKSLQEMKQEQEVEKFLQAHPEFPRGQAGVILNQTREQLGQPMTKAGLEASLNHAIQNNRLPDFRIQAALNQQQQAFINYLQANNLPLPQANNQSSYQPPVNNVPQNPYPVMTNQGPAGIPTISRTQSQMPKNVENALEGLSLDQITKLMKDNGLL